MKSKFILLPALLLITFSCFSQLPHKNGKAPQKKISKRITELINPALLRDTLVHVLSQTQTNKTNPNALVPKVSAVANPLVKKK